MDETYSKVHRTFPNGHTDTFELNRVTERFWTWEKMQVLKTSGEPQQFFNYSSLLRLDSASISDGTLYLKYGEYCE